LLAEIGARIVGMTDWKGGVYNENGLDLAGLTDHVRQHKTVAGFPGGTPLSNQELFKLDVDVLNPGRAREPDSRIENAPGIRAKVIVEGRQRPHDPRGPQAPVRTRRLRGARHPSPTAAA
jgi:glutamate dehydrogenase/leucine dehydrogenase